MCSVGLFSSCGDDNGEPKGDDLVEKLQGTWYFDVMKIKVAGQVLEFTADELKHESGYDGFYDEKLTFSGNRVNGLEYSVKKNSVLLPWYEEQDWWATVSFSGSKMTMYYSVYSEGVKWSCGQSTVVELVASPKLRAMLLRLEQWRLMMPCASAAPRCGACRAGVTAPDAVRGNLGFEQG